MQNAMTVVDNVVSKSITIHAPVSVVWQALTVAERMKTWMAEEEIEILTDWEVGGPITIRGQLHGMVFENRGRVLSVEPEQVLCYTHLSSISALPDIPESYTIFDFSLEPVQDRTTITLRLSNFPSEAIYKHLVFYWNVALGVLKKQMEYVHH